MLSILSCYTGLTCLHLITHTMSKRKRGLFMVDHTTLYHCWKRASMEGSDSWDYHHNLDLWYEVIYMGGIGCIGILLEVLSDGINGLYDFSISIYFSFPSKSIPSYPFSSFPPLASPRRRVVTTVMALAHGSQCRGRCATRQLQDDAGRGVPRHPIGHGSGGGLHPDRRC
jgi:hypothetical protein